MADETSQEGQKLVPEDMMIITTSGWVPLRGWKPQWDMPSGDLPLCGPPSEQVSSNQVYQERMYAPWAIWLAILGQAFSTVGRVCVGNKRVLMWKWDPRRLTAPRGAAPSKKADNLREPLRWWQRNKLHFIGHVVYLTGFRWWFSGKERVCQ